MKSVSHSGTIVKIEGNKAHVKIESRAACVSCQMNKNCNISEKADKYVDVELHQQKKYTIGQEVELVISQSQGWLAVFLGYMLPFLLVVLVLFSLILLKIEEGIAAMVSLALLLLYYFILSKFRSKMSKKFQFRLKE